MTFKQILEEKEMYNTLQSTAQLQYKKYITSLKEYAKLHGVTQDQLAKECDFTNRTTVNRIFTAKHVAKYENLCKIEKSLQKLVDKRA